MTEQAIDAALRQRLPVTARSFLRRGHHANPATIPVFNAVLLNALCETDEVDKEKLESKKTQREIRDPAE